MSKLSKSTGFINQIYSPSLWFSRYINGLVPERQPLIANQSQHLLPRSVRNREKRISGEVLQVRSRVPMGQKFEAGSNHEHIIPEDMQQY